MYVKTEIVIVIIVVVVVAVVKRILTRSQNVGLSFNIGC